MTKIVSFILVLLLTVSCARTYVPVYVSDKVASFDGNAQNSGIIGVLKEGGFLVTERFHARYVALGELYGDSFTPALKPGEGCVPVSGFRFEIKDPKTKAYIPFVGDADRLYYAITAEAMVKHLNMSDMKKNGIEPKGVWGKVKDKLGIP